MVDYIEYVLSGITLPLGFEIYIFRLIYKQVLVSPWPDANLYFYPFFLVPM